MNICFSADSGEDIVSFYRGSTPTLIFTIEEEDFSLDDVETCHVTIETDCQKKQKIFENPEIDTENKTVSQTLSQEDTLYWDPGNLSVQLKMKLKDGVTAVLSDIFVLQVKRSLEDSVL